MARPDPSRQTRMVAMTVVAITIVGYFTGLQAPMRPELSADGDHFAHHSAMNHSPDGDERGEPAPPSIIPATSYAAMAEATRRRAPTDLRGLKHSIDLTAAVEIQPGEKEQALQARDLNRAFNGAPPTIPHAIHQFSSESCMACHGEGVKTASLRVPQMSHAYLQNCTQCHVEAKQSLLTATLEVGNDFQGLPAPTGGPRAFPAAPPQIPHTTWMRNDCNSCHGPTGRQGLRTTHPWRRSCQQCHAPSSELDQTRLTGSPQFLPPPQVGSAP